jgi:SAM domain (Sterile alpha motif)
MSEYTQRFAENGISFAALRHLTDQDLKGRLGIHSCFMGDGTPSPECNKEMAANALAHGVPWGVIESFGNQTKPSDVMWFGAEDAECNGLMQWSAEDDSHLGRACFLWATFTNDKRKPTEVTAKNADDIVCRMNAGTSRIYVPTGRDGQGFSDTYAAIDIIMWLILTDPDILALKPGTLMVRILEYDNNHIGNCWKCLTIMGMSELMLGYPREALKDFQKAVSVVKRDTGSAPGWLTSRVDSAAAEAAKQKD